ncbi:MAG: hypothetical protein QME35_02930 [Thermoanaerobacteraceae bacterium]|nr:hypothetical protein [Thermoanaerobacteraceae bacterium]
MWSEFMPVKDQKKLFHIADLLRRVCKEVRIEQNTEGWKLMIKT